MPAASRQSMMRNLYADEPLDCPDGRRKKWWSLTGSNRRHPACKAGALPAELRPRKGSPCEARAAVRSSRQPDPMVGPGRLELPTSRLSGVRSNHLSYGPAWKATHRNQQAPGITDRPQAHKSPARNLIRGRKRDEDGVSRHFGPDGASSHRPDCSKRSESTS